MAFADLDPTRDIYGCVQAGKYEVQSPLGYCYGYGKYSGVTLYCDTQCWGEGHNCHPDLKKTPLIYAVCE
ncbi:unnamed protein product [Zymoseptoria tritici ST99CH_3D1]|uniref:Uncharacterized protein n=2 Tax=Zymoseptoria tritici TaxID=1047171 RepID=A0A1X7RJR7_ZYMT9|nr:unnamed protein product [Zymoseptoria tritici ST99CH_3D7]SMR46194.1 unnamed protein product [Zymoseptoria tritici ST99CH_1E4]SMR47445.1 unnamed protein product [Zymoseptoria tritici ST99CH_3D1]